ncbi:MAG: hypothetical protein M9915_08460 [Rhizobacter sp.]|nr:hypothetical protein [Burkholderiaceae bacterium]MCO5123757.1 hypothetical protein [Rhizobacter sp.]
MSEGLRGRLCARASLRCARRACSDGLGVHWTRSSSFFAMAECRHSAHGAAASGRARAPRRADAAVDNADAAVGDGGEVAVVGDGDDGLARVARRCAQDVARCGMPRTRIGGAMLALIWGNAERRSAARHGEPAHHRHRVRHQLVA